MTERERLILNGKKIDPATADEAAISTAIKNAGSGSDLPEPGTAGNVLTSTGDGWESAAPADATALEFALTIGESITCDEAVADIVNALETNRPVMGVVEGAGTLVVKTWSAELNKVVLLLYIPDGNKLTVVEFNGTSGTPDTWAMDEPDEINGVPSVSASNNGQVLGVSDGAYALIDALPLIVHGEVNGSAATITDSGLTLADIYNAAEAGRSVYYECSLDTNSKTRLGLAGRSLDNGAYELTFSAAAISSNAPAVITVTFDSNGGTFAIAVAQ